MNAQVAVCGPVNGPADLFNFMPNSARKAG